MRSQELIESFSSIAREKNIDRTELGTIIEDLFLSLVEKQYGDALNCSVIVNIDKGEIEIYQEKTVVEEVNDPVHEIELEKALKVEPDLELGDPFIELIDPLRFGRRLVSAAKQLLAQKIRDIERQNVYEEYLNRVNEIVIGDVRQIHRDNVYVYIDQCELRMSKEEQIELEHYRRGDTIHALVKSVTMTPKGPEIVISRSDNQFLSKLFEMEVPEIEDGIIEILSIARSPGDRAKIIVKSSDKRIDAVGACVGMRGSRIQAIVRELNGEKIDVINYSTQPEVLVSRALAPSKPIDLYIDDEKKYCLAVFDDEDIESAVGKNYQNVNLASDVTNYTIDVVKKSQYEAEKQERKPIYLKQVTGITTRILEILEKAHIHTVQDLMNSPRDAILDIKGIGDKTLDKLVEKIDTYMEILHERETEKEESSNEISKSEEVK